MTTFIYNDTEFKLEPAGEAWDITRLLPDGSSALLGAGLFAGLDADAAQLRARALVMAACPVGVKSVGPDVAHPNMIGDLKLVGPDVSHPNFIRWDQDSSSFPAQG